MDAATGRSLPCGRYLLAPLTGNREGSKSLIALRVKPRKNRFPTNSLSTPMDNTPLHSISIVCHPLCEDNNADNLASFARGTWRPVTN